MQNSYAFYIKNEKKKKSLSNNLSVFTGLLIAILFIYFMIIVIIPNLVNSVVRLIQIIPDNVNKVIDFVQKFLNENETLMKYSENIIDKTYTFINDWLGNEFLGYAQGIASGVSTGVVNIIVVLFNVINNGLFYTSTGFTSFFFPGIHPQMIRAIIRSPTALPP